MPAISATAPGKVILLGEHAVVYGQPAIAVPVFQVRARAIVIPQPGEPPGWIRVQAPDIGVDALASELKEGDPLKEALQQVIKQTGVARPPALTLRVSSTIPVASGLGSGAAVSVAIIRALAEFLGLRLPEDRVSDLAYEVEKIHHGTPSGIDNSVVTYARPIYFERQPVSGEKRLETLPVGQPFTLVIGDSGVLSSTARAVGSVRESWKANPQYFESIFLQIGELVRKARRTIEAGDLQTLGFLMGENQALLNEIGVSSEELDRLVRAALRAGALGAKLSGAGLGGNMIALVAAEKADKMANVLKSAGAVRTYITRIGDGTTRRISGKYDQV